MSDITLYFARASRSFTPRWLLEELGVPYAVKTLRLGRGDHKTRAYLRVNPMGKVPALTDGEVRVTENPAICLYLADRYGMGTLAPAVDDPRRGDFLRWMVFSTAVFEPAIYLPEDDDASAASGRGWGTKTRVVEVLADTMRDREWLLGDMFSAADVMLGSLVSIALFNDRIPGAPDSLVAWNARMSARPAYQSAAEATWG